MSNSIVSNKQTITNKSLHNVFMLPKVTIHRSAKYP